MKHKKIKNNKVEKILKATKELERIERLIKPFKVKSEYTQTQNVKLWENASSVNF